jgi:probable F420-dependent oxidoreductase
LWVAEAVGREPFVAAAVLLSATERLPVATGIANIYARDPMTMAAAQKTLAEAYPGRFLLGIGVSHGHLVAGVRKHDWSKPYSYMVDYLAKMDKALFMARGPEADPGRILAALGPKMLELSATRANGSHPYFTTPDHTRIAREVMGAEALLAPEQMVVLSTDATEARRIARAGMKIYLGLPNYFNNLKRIGFDESDFAVWSTPSWRGVPRSRSRHASPNTMQPAPTTCACRCCRTALRCLNSSGVAWRPPCSAGESTRRLIGPGR